MIDVRRMVLDQLARHPLTKQAYQSEAIFHVSVDTARNILSVVAEHMQSAGVPQFQAEKVLQGTLDEMLHDDHIHRRREAERLGRGPWIHRAPAYLERP